MKKKKVEITIKFSDEKINFTDFVDEVLNFPEEPKQKNKSKKK